MHLSNGHSRSPDFINALWRYVYQFLGANFEPYNDLVNFRQPFWPCLFRNPLSVCINSSLDSIACGNAFTQSTEIVIHDMWIANTMKNWIVLHCTTGAYESELSSIRSPLKQILALHLMISPAGFLLYRNTQVQGTICSPLASDLRHSVHTPFPSSCLISFSAAANQSLVFLWSHIASSYDRMSGFFFLVALNTWANWCGCVQW